MVSHEHASNNMTQEVDLVTDVLIIGTGPAGASLASFLSYYSIETTIVSKERSTTTEPRAHLTIQPAVECFRDVGLETELLDASVFYDKMPFWRWCSSIAGEEFRRDRHFAEGRPNEYLESSPCQNLDLPQNVLEPILIKRATQEGAKVRWNTEFVSCVEDGPSVITTLLDHQTQKTFKVRSRYLCGADGGRSKVVQQIGASLTGPQQEVATCYSIGFEADISKYMNRAPSMMQFVLQPDKEIKGWCMTAIVRTIHLWNQFQLVAIPAPWFTPLKNLDDVDWEQTVSDLIGDSSVEVKITLKSRYRVNEVNADIYSKGNIFCLGDAVHRHPPHNGLGSNTCIQDAYNLAWKLAYSIKGIASPKLLESYNLERQSVGASVVKRANDSLRLEIEMYGAIGLLQPELKERKKHLQSLEGDSEEGRKMRKRLKDAFAACRAEYNGPGTEMNHFYRSNAIHIEDETEHAGPTYEDLAMIYTQGTIPGMRLPHAWLTTSVPGETISTQDLAGKGRFTLVTGNGGKQIWTEAAATASKEFPGLEVQVCSIGWRQEYGDPFFQWENNRGIEEDGAVLVRPDRFVCWRSQKKMKPAEAATKLQKVLSRILGWSK